MGKTDAEEQYRGQCRSKTYRSRNNHAKLAEDVGIAAFYISCVINGYDKVVNRTFIQIMEALGYDVELTYVKKI